MTGYRDFLASKRLMAQAMGFQVEPGALNARLFPFQADIVRWALARGRAAIFAECGLGKTAMQLEWSYQVNYRTGGDVLILAPLAVTAQTWREGLKFGTPVTICRSQADVRSGINVANYERLDAFDPTLFEGVVLDESSILKSYMGKTKRALVQAFASTPYRLCCTATPAPNDHIELGNHSEFLGILPSNEMLSRWFINDTTRTGIYRLKDYAQGDFWDWVASWAVSMRRPSDIGYPDEGFDLPELRLQQVNVPVNMTEAAGGRLFRMPVLSATELHREMRLTAPARARAVAEMVNSSVDTWVVWCNTNYEADELMMLIPDAIEVRGSEDDREKERKLTLFSEGGARVMVSKPSIAGFGLNWQHCHRLTFVGLSYSFEQLYQAIRRCWRFGQQYPVDAYLVVAETEGAVLASIQQKMQAHERLQEGMNRSSAKLLKGEDLRLAEYEPAVPMRVPGWLRSVA